MKLIKYYDQFTSIYLNDKLTIKIYVFIFFYLFKILLAYSSQ